ncbi:hypothetical protein [Phytoactinopolyspora mesophila]|uniref:Uncharacterized protein n=1 Tax=Phytoactinopolyspora mesophila TaxID=2650750 RepID=A0A7K3M0I9_9ACTN|nr:hypothetical protein [Phytoactinopolyspora mesophila]NDL56815.1 hypothetical protein [Phytoactinopolyspora mesophila]
MLFKRTSGADVQGLEQGERVLATAEGPDGRLAATDRRLLWPGGSIYWHEVDRATWKSDENEFDVTPVATSDHAKRYRIPLSEPGRLVDVVREQVIASVVITRHVPLDGRRGVRVTGRRKADRSLVWHAVLDAGVDVEAPQIRERLDAAVAQVRSEIE